MNAPETLSDWVTFLSHSHQMTQEEVDAKIRTSLVKKAFEICKIELLPQEVQKKYEGEDKNFVTYI